MRQNQRDTPAVTLHNLKHNSNITMVYFLGEIIWISWKWHIQNQADKQSSLLNDKLLRNTIFASI